MTEQNPSTEPAIDGTPATEHPVVAGAGQTFDDLDSTTPLSANGDDDAGPAGHDSPDAGDPDEG